MQSEGYKTSPEPTRYYRMSSLQIAIGNMEPKVQEMIIYCRLFEFPLLRARRVVTV